MEYHPIRPTAHEIDGIYDALVTQTLEAQIPHTLVHTLDVRNSRPCAWNVYSISLPAVDQGMPLWLPPYPCAEENVNNLL